MKRLSFISFTLLALLCLTNVAMAAEYLGQNIDGELYSVTAYSYSTGKYYYGNVEFYGDQATLYFNNGGYITLNLDDEEINDPNNISAYDYQRSVFWLLDLD